MQSEQTIFQCPYCGNQFDQTTHQPMILCISQHTSCNECVSKMFRNKRKQEQIDCPFRCGKIQLRNIQPFRHFKEIIETKFQLKTMKSVLRKQKISYDLEKIDKINRINQLEKLLEKEREKNEWLIQINQKRQNISSSAQTDKIIKELTKQFKKQRQKMEENVFKALAQMQKQTKMLKSKFQEHGQRVNQKISASELETKKNQKTLEKQLEEQTNIIKKLQQPFKPSENQKNKESEDLLLKSIKNLETENAKILKQMKIEHKNVNKDEVIKKPQVKQEKKIFDKKLSLPVNNNVQITQTLFQKKNNIFFDANKEQKGNKYQLNSSIKIQKASEKMKTEPNQKFQVLKMPYLNLKTNQMRASMGLYQNPSQTYRNNDEVDLSARTSREKNSFKPSNKNNYKFQSQKDLLASKSMIEYQAAQSQKVDVIMEKLQKIYGKFTISSKSSRLKAFINEEIHLTEKQIIEQIQKKFKLQQA